MSRMTIRSDHKEVYSIQSMNKRTHTAGLYVFTRDGMTGIFTGLSKIYWSNLLFYRMCKCSLGTMFLFQEKYY